MPTSTSSDASTSAAKAFITGEARAAGFDDAAVADLSAFGEAPGERLHQMVAEGQHGEMAWLKDTAGRRRHPLALWPDVRSVVMLAQNYGPEGNPLDDLAETDRGVVSVYARGRDYHDVMKGRMKTLAQRLVSRFGGDVKVFVDTAPVMEKPLAAAAGLGWQGKHTNLVSRNYGSWLFLGALFTTLPLEPDPPHEDRCGSCTRCLDICPTDAFPAPYRLDARRCIAYLTIEARGMIPVAFRRAMGNRVFGCDDCLAVCPWNRFAKVSAEMQFAPREGPAPLDELGRLDDAAFRKRYAGTPVKRLGRERFVRNVMIAAGNAGRGRHDALIAERVADEAPQVRAAAAWAARQTMDEAPLRRLAGEALGRERDPMVRAEWDL